MDRDDEDEDDQAPLLAPALQPRAPPLDWSAWSIDAIELLLQAFLRYLGAFVDLLDRIISAFEAPGDSGAEEQRPRRQEQPRSSPGDSLFVRLARNLIPGFPVLPQDRSSLWLPSIAVLLVCFIVLGFRTGFRLFRIVEVVPEQEPEPERTPSKRLLLLDGRYIAYRELGVSAEKSKHSGLVVQGFTALRQADVPGLNSSVLEQFKIRLVAYDLPGFGLSDPNPNSTFNSSAQDMELIANALRLGEKFWLLVHPGGGPFAWAAIRYIPDRLSGVVMLGPVGNPAKSGDMPDIETGESDRKKQQSLTWSFLARIPGLRQLFPARKEVKKKITKIHKGLYATVADKEQALFEQREFITFWEQNLRYSTPDESTDTRATPTPRSAPSEWILIRVFKFFKPRFRFPSLPIGPSLRLVKSLIVWWWPVPTRKEPKEGAASAPAAATVEEELPPSEVSPTWQAFKFKFLLVVSVLVISLLVLR